MLDNKCSTLFSGGVTREDRCAFGRFDAPLFSEDSCDLRFSWLGRNRLKKALILRKLL